ncbi:hypothetical protein [Tamlana crocina]|uniref:Uncharacterized protein n=1 Tax=Tamlana crocina TaxID=393006 RepID=A0ABX1DFC9_9FLAO|nr:hypothetical protein [Tamlana crocina]NJX17033.1 hypothetical protein [Tamlana crocina]
MIISHLSKGRKDLIQTKAHLQNQLRDPTNQLFEAQSEAFQFCLESIDPSLRIAFQIVLNISSVFELRTIDAIFYVDL